MVAKGGPVMPAVRHLKTHDVPLSRKQVRRAWALRLVLGPLVLPQQCPLSRARKGHKEGTRKEGKRKGEEKGVRSRIPTGSKEEQERVTQESARKGSGLAFQLFCAILFLWQDRLDSNWQACCTTLLRVVTGVKPFILMMKIG